MAMRGSGARMVSNMMRHLNGQGDTKNTKVSEHYESILRNYRTGTP